MKTYINKQLKITLGILPLVLAGLVLAGALVLSDKPAKSSALSGSSFRAGNIIDDAVFYNDSAMSVSQIQQFLNARVPNCDTNGDLMHWSGMTRRDWAAQSSSRDNPPYTCLKEYTEQIPSVSNSGSDLCTGNISGGNRTAARIIHDVGKACGINPQVLIVMLQKEQSLITDDWPWEIQYNRAMGYACPDSGPNNSANCNSAYYGFFNQVYQAAQAFRRYEANPTWYNYRANRDNFIYYHRTTNNGQCGGSNVFIENQATANLYIYTPYQPNQAALNNLYGTGDSCSEYGNRNFWRMFNDWFGTTHSTAIETVLLEPDSDKTGKRARVGVRLSKKPTHNVRIPVAVSSPSNAEVVGTQSVLIRRNDWNDPTKNVVTIRGLDNPHLTGTHQYRLVFSRPISADNRYSSISASMIDDVHLVQQDTNSPPNVYRLYSPDLRQHFFTASRLERNSRIADGWRDEGARFHYCYAGSQTMVRMKKGDSTRLVRYDTSAYTNALAEDYAHDSVSFTASGQGTVPVYEKYNPVTGNRLYTTAAGEATSDPWVDNGVAFYACQEDNRPIYRLYRSSTKSHFFTLSPRERDGAEDNHGFRYEGTGFYTCTSSVTTPVYRLYRPSAGNHFFTTSASERDNAVSTHGFRNEGVGFRLCDNSTSDVFRLYNPSTRNHFYTTSTLERDRAVSNHGFRNEGSRFKAL